MSYVTIYNDETNTYYRVNFDLKNSVLRNIGGSVDYEVCLLITTTMKYPDNTSFGTFEVKTLDDVPPGETPPAIDFTDLCKMYIDYFLTESTIGKSSSSSSSKSSGSTGSSSTSSYMENWSTSSLSSILINSTSSNSSDSTGSSESTIEINSSLSSASTIEINSSLSSASSDSAIDPLIVTGNSFMTPDVSGTYSADGIYDGYNQYKRADSNYYAWYDSGVSEYVISAVVGVGPISGADCFVGVNDTNPRTAYFAAGPAALGTVITDGLSATVSKVGTNIDGVPNAAGNYILVGNYQTYNVYVRSDKAYYLFYYDTYSTYAITEDLYKAGPIATPAEASYFNSTSGGAIDGTYTSGAAWTGTLTVADPI